jgi:hypothetical protein
MRCGSRAVHSSLLFSPLVRVCVCVCVCAGRAGVPMEVMGLMLGQFVDEYTITCVDVFAMPQVSSE